MTAARWIERLARLGYASKGSVYAVIGLLALASIFGRGRVTNHHGAFLAIGSQPFGTLLLHLIALGLLGYAAWRVVEAFADPERRGSDAKGLAIRAVLLARGVFHVYIAYEVFRIATTRGGENGGAQHWTSRVIEKPFGVWLVGIGGVAIAAYGLGQIIAAIVAKLDKRLRLGTIAPPQRRWIVRLSRFGLTARGVIFATVGWFLVRAALQHDPSQARDIGGVLREVASGPMFLAALAVGLVAYGAYEFLKARYKRIAA